MNGKIKRKIDNGYVRLHEAVSDSVYMRGDGVKEQTLTEFAKSHRISVLHMSDIHSITSVEGYNKLKAMLTDDSSDEDYSDDDVIGLSTGDLTLYGSGNYDDYKYYTEGEDSLMYFNNFVDGKEILHIKGNHDAWETNAGKADNAETRLEGQCNTRLMQPINDGHVTWGTIGTTKKGYWYRDFMHNGVKLRIIALDEYQYGDEGEYVPAYNYPNKYSKVYSTGQVAWIASLLRSASGDGVDYIIMVHHQPLYTQHPVEVLNDFIHHGKVGSEYSSGNTFTHSMFTYYNGDGTTIGNVDLPARIVDAYLHRKQLTYTCLNGKSTNSLEVSVDFRDVTPVKFACHIGGHVHGDYCEYHPYFPEQLCLTIGTTSTSQSSSYQDLVRSGGGANNYAINRVTIDADRDVVEVERIGASTLDTSKTWLIQDGSARKAIEFPIKPVAVEPTPADAIATYCPIIEDTRSSAVAAITGVAPFASLVDGQRIVVKLNNNTVANATLVLTLSGGNTLAAKPLYYLNQAGINRWGGNQYLAGCYVSMVYDITNDRWIVPNSDKNTLYNTMSQALLDAGTATGGYMIPPKLLRDNFYTESEVDANFAAKNGNTNENFTVKNLNVGSVQIQGTTPTVIFVHNQYQSTPVYLNVCRGRSETIAFTSDVATKQDVTAIVGVPSGAFPVGGYDANKMYNFGKESAVAFFSFNTASEISGCVNLYMCTFQVASGGTTLRLNANTMYPNGEDANSLDGLLSTEDRVFEITIRRIVVTENNENVSYYLMSYLYFD